MTFIPNVSIPANIIQRFTFRASPAPERILPSEGFSNSDTYVTNPALGVSMTEEGIESAVNDNVRAMLGKYGLKPKVNTEILDELNR